MTVPARCRTRRASALATTLMLAILAGCARDDSATGPDQGPPPDGPAERENLQSGTDVRANLVSHYADGTAFNYDPTNASYTLIANAAFNRSGGAVSITRQSEGAYTVRFAGLSAVLGSKSTVRVTAWFDDNTYCKPVNQLLSDVVHIKCFDAASGRVADAYYAVYITKSYGDLAFAFANQPTAANYAPPGSASHNPSGAIRVIRNSVGFYTVRFTGFGSKLTSNGGHAQAIAIGTGAQHCKVGGWAGSPDLNVTVRCFSRDGLPKDVKFNVLFVTPNPTLAYAWGDFPTATSYSPHSFYRSNPSGGAVTILRLGTGRYRVTWNGLLPFQAPTGVHVTAYGAGNIICSVEQLVSIASPFADVRCFDPGTSALVDSKFDIMYFS